MFAYARLAEGLLLSHLMLAVAFVLGANAVSWDRSERVLPAAAMVRLVCTCALGFAFLGFGAFFIASVGLFVPAGAVAMILAIFGLGCAIARRSPFDGAYWRRLGVAVSDAIDVPDVALYFAMLVVAFPAINIVNAGADALAFHWAYAIDFVRHGSLVVDPFLRETFYAQNDLMLVALVMLFGGGIFAQFVMWSMGLLTAWGVCAGIRQAFAKRDRWIDIASVLLAAAVVYSPVYLRWLDSGYLDAALGFFALAAVLALARSLRDGATDWRWLCVAAALAAFLIGSKTSLLPMIVVFGAALILAARRLGCSRAQMALLAGILVVLSAPWYARNLVLAGDPIAPWINLAVYGHDGLVTRDEWRQIADDLNTDKRLTSLMTVPWRLFTEPDTPPFREFATNALVLFIFVPTVLLFVLMTTSTRRPPPAVTYPVVMLTVFVLYWLFSATFARYALLFLPLLGLCCGLIASAIRIRLQILGPALAIVAACCLIISPTAEAHGFYDAFFQNGVQNAPLYYTGDEPFLRTLVDGYSEERFASAFMNRSRLKGRLYLVASNIGYYYRRDGIESVGDWIGPAGWHRLFRALDEGRVTAFLGDLNVDAVLVDPHFAYGGLDVPLERALLAGGFCRIPIPDSRMQLFARTKGTCASIAGRT